MKRSMINRLQGSLCGLGMLLQHIGVDKDPTGKTNSIMKTATSKQRTIALACTLAVLFLGLTTLPVWAGTCYVATNGNDSAAYPGVWQTLSNAVKKAHPGDTITVSNGTYYLTASVSILTNNLTIQGSSGNAADVLIDGSNKVQGFNTSGATVTNLSFLNFTLQNCTNSSGGGGINIGGTSITNFYCYGCVFSNCWCGTAAAPGGGAVLLNGAAACTYLFTNCQFLANICPNPHGGAGGGAIEEYNGLGSNLICRGCSFIGNQDAYLARAVLVYNCGYNFELNGCTFTANIPSTGSAVGSVVDCYPKAGGVSLVTNCTFVGNSLSGNGCLSFNSAVQTATVVKCSFISNTNNTTAASTYSAGVFGDASCYATISNCSFVGNAMTNRSGGALALGGGGIVTGCGFTNNYAAQWGGAFVTPVAASNVTFSGCSFTSNTCLGAGGLAYMYGGNTLSNCTFFGNASLVTNSTSCGTLCLLSGSNNFYGCTFSNNWGWQSGVICPLAGATGSFVNCLFVGNVATGYHGGVLCGEAGMQALGSTFLFRNCGFFGNQAFSNGGAICTYKAPSLTLDNCTLAKNSCGAPNGGGAININEGSDAIKTTVYLANCLVYSNFAAGVTNDISIAAVNTGLFWNCCTPATNANSFAGTCAITNCFTNNPLFVNSGSGYGTNLLFGSYDFRLQKGSICIDHGTNEAWSLLTGATDLGGNPRILQNIVDIGCYEYKIPSSVGTAVFFR